MFGEFDRDKHPFGMATYYPQVEDHVFEFLDPAQQEQFARDIGYSEGCPIPGEVIAQKGPLEAAKRYSNLSRWFNVFMQKTLAANPELYRQIAYPKPREKGEVPQKFEPDAVPADYLQNLPPKCTPFGFAGPRILEETILTETKGKRLPTLSELVRTYQVVDRTVEQAHSPEDFLVLLAETVVEKSVSSPWAEITISGVNPDILLRHLLSRALLHEQGTKAALYEVGANIHIYAPTLSERLNKLTSKTANNTTLTQLGIASYDELVSS